MIRSVVVAAAAGVLVAGASVLGSAPVQAAVPAVSTVAVTAFQMPAGGDAPVAGEREFDSSNATLTVGWSSGGNVAVAASNPDGTTVSVSVGAGIGLDRFSLGYHVAAFSPAEPGPADLEVAVDGITCDGSGGIDVRDLAYSGTTITRLDLVWAMYCGAVPGQVNETGQFGEIQIGEPQSASVLMGSRVIEFSPLPVGALSKAVPVVISNRGTKAVSVGAPSIGGSNPGAFAITSNTCGKTLAAHADCSIFVRFGPHVPGARSAQLAVLVGGVARNVELDAATFVGSSSFTAITGGGRVPGSGTNYSFTDANALFVIGYGVSASVNSGTFLLRFAGPDNALPQVGTYSNTSNAIAGAPFLSVFGPGSGCDQIAGSFTVKQAVYASYGLGPNYQFPTHLHIVYSEHCVGGTNTMSGEFSYDAVAAITSPPAVTAFSATGNAAAVTVHWTNPTHTWAYTVIRVQPSSGNDAAAQAVTGTPVYSGSSKSATIHGLTKGVAYTISAFTVDAYGNVTGPTETHITP